MPQLLLGQAIGGNEDELLSLELETLDSDDELSELELKLDETGLEEAWLDDDREDLDELDRGDEELTDEELVELVDELDTDELVVETELLVDTDDGTLLKEEIVEDEETRLELLTGGVLELAPEVSSAGAPPQPAKILDSIKEAARENLECLFVSIKNLMSIMSRCYLSFGDARC